MSWKYAKFLKKRLKYGLNMLLDVNILTKFVEVRRVNNPT
jgi:hypothetical protein